LETLLLGNTPAGKKATVEMVCSIGVEHRRTLRNAEPARKFRGSDTMNSRFVDLHNFASRILGQLGTGKGVLPNPSFNVGRTERKTEEGLVIRSFPPADSEHTVRVHHLRDRCLKVKL